MATNIQKIFEFTCIPYDKARELRSEDSCKSGLSSRALFLAQTICSLVAVPFILLAGIFTTAIALCSDGKANAWKELEGTWESLKLTSLLIPVSLINILAPCSCQAVDSHISNNNDPELPADYVGNPTPGFLNCNLTTLGLDLNEKATVNRGNFQEFCHRYIPDEFSLRDAVTDVITAINKVVQTTQRSPKGDGFIIINTREPWVKFGSNLFFYENYCGLPADQLILGQEYRGKDWLSRILTALVDKNYIEYVKKYYGHCIKVLS
jgi:hypothetical protein